MRESTVSVSPPQTPHHVLMCGHMYHVLRHCTATHHTATHLLSHGLNKLRLLSKRGPQLCLLTNLHQVKSQGTHMYTEDVDAMYM